MYERQERCIAFLVEKYEGKRTHVSVGGGGGNIEMDSNEGGWESVEWIYLAQSRYKWLALVNPVIKIGGP
jgi:hypothetical protein